MKLPIFLILLYAASLLFTCSEENINRNASDDFHPFQLVYNGGFEDHSLMKQIPSRWFKPHSNTVQDHAIYHWDNQIFHTGDRSVSIEIPVTHQEIPASYYWSQTLNNFQPGHTYKLRAWVKTKNLNRSAWIKIMFPDKFHHSFVLSASTAESSQLTGTSDWKEIILIFTIPPGTRRILLKTGLDAIGNDGGKVWFDDIQIYAEDYLKWYEV
ncbi:MAG: carbohydrate binding domain-containing protein [Calditrichaceae bacterium]